MSIILIVAIGALTGWLVAAVLEYDEGMFAHMALGAVGAVIGSIIPGFLARNQMLAMSWATVLWATLGALLVTGIASAVSQPNKNSGV